MSRATSTSTYSLCRRRTSRRTGSRRRRFGAVAKEHGALSYREFRGDDVGESLRVPDGRVLTVAVAEFDSRSHRDEVMAKVMEDPRVTKMLEGEQLADMEQMRYGGFQAFVNP